jgi:hypothetical protein
MLLKLNNETTHLVIPDSHAKPGASNRRYDWLGQLIKDIKPDVIINIGDHADMESLCSYDKGTKGFEGRRYTRDIDAAIDASERLEAAGGAAYSNARKIMCTGNHEDRISRACNFQAELDGVISLDDLQYEEFYDEVYPFRQSCSVDGVSYCHYFVSGIMGRPIGGVHLAHSMVTKNLTSCTQGHTHVFDHKLYTTQQGKTCQGMSVGCYFEHREAYAGPANDMWWRGIVVKENVKAGRYDPRPISLSRIKKAYKDG